MAFSLSLFCFSFVSNHIIQSNIPHLHFIKSLTIQQERTNHTYHYIDVYILFILSTRDTLARIATQFRVFPLIQCLISPMILRGKRKKNSNSYIQVLPAVPLWTKVCIRKRERGLHHHHYSSENRGGKNGQRNA
jgi:hypothetical protein